jgi:hypothetical protein
VGRRGDRTYQREQGTERVRERERRKREKVTDLSLSLFDEPLWDLKESHPHS